MQALRPDGQEYSFTNYFLEDPSLIDKINNNIKKKVVLYDLPQIQAYRKLNKPVVSEEKKKIIKEKLDLEQESLLQTKQRQKRNDLFINYNDNPFIDFSPHTKFLRNSLKNQGLMNQEGQRTQKQKNLPLLLTKDEKEAAVSDLVTQLNSITVKDPKPDFLKMRENFRILMKNADLFSNKIIEISSNKEDFEFFRGKKINEEELFLSIIERGLSLAAEKNKRQQKGKDRKQAMNSQNNSSKQSKKGVAGEQLLEKLPENILCFDEIIEIKQENYFMKSDALSQKPLNIFKVSFNKSQKEIIGKQLLDKYFFSFTSMVEKLQKLKIPIYRDISRMARRISLGVSTGKDGRFDYIDSYQLSFKTNALNFADLMSVASGRFSPQFVYNTTNFDLEQNVIKETSETSSQEDQEQIFYDSNTENKSIRFHNKGEQQQQIINYLKLEYNSRQEQYKAQCEQFKQSIFSELKMKEKLISTTIQDKDLHGIINQSIKKQLLQIVNLDQKEIEIDRLIRINKMNKNKNVSIKLEKILEIFQKKKQDDQLINFLGIFQQDNEISNNLKLKNRQINRPSQSNNNPKKSIPGSVLPLNQQLLNSSKSNQQSSMKIKQKRHDKKSTTPQKIVRSNDTKNSVDKTIKKTPVWNY